MEGRLTLDDVDQFGSHGKLKKKCLFLENHSCIHSKSKLSFVCVAISVLTSLVVV